MHKQLPTWHLIQRSLQEKLRVMLLYVLHSSGSSPGRQGFFMAVNELGAMSGSLGGGIMEHKFVELSKSRMRQPGEEKSIHRQVHDKQVAKDRSGMICSGEQTIFLYSVQEADERAIALLIQSMETHSNGSLHLSPGGISFSTSLPAMDFYYSKEGENDFTYIEKTGYKNDLYIIGGGHCALALSRIMKGLDFCIHLFDERKGLNTIMQNHFIQETRIIKDYSELTNQVAGGPNAYVVVMTVGYRTDIKAVMALLGKRFRYMGVLGSKNKIAKMFREIAEMGIEEELLAKLNAPVGIPIHSQTTEEIAVSIAAEIIRVKNSPTGR